MSILVDINYQLGNLELGKLYRPTSTVILYKEQPLRSIQSRLSLPSEMQEAGKKIIGAKDIIMVVENDVLPLYYLLHDAGHWIWDNANQIDKLGAMVLFGKTRYWISANQFSFLKKVGIEE